MMMRVQQDGKVRQDFPIFAEAKMAPFSRWKSRMPVFTAVKWIFVSIFNERSEVKM